jgi:porphobilinogen synthase
MSIGPSFPAARPRRLRRADWVRRLTRETKISADDLIFAVVVHDGPEPEIAVKAMPGAPRLSVAKLAETAQEAQALGIPMIAVFPQIDPSLKDRQGSEALNPEGLAPRAVKAMKAAAPNVGVMVDIALDPFTDHGHDGVINDAGIVLNDETLDRLVDQALMLAAAGADVVAPSDMMDGRVGRIRQALERALWPDVAIMAYAAKYASAFYGPYREAIGSSAALKGDKKTYQMDPANTDEALRAVALDVAEGADLLLVKPGMPYLDIVHRVKTTFGLPTFAFQVSGEYAMIKAAGANGWLDEDRAILESLMAFRRAGADGVVSYFALHAARLLAR